MGKAPESIKLEDGAKATRDIVAESKSRGASPDRPGWPIECLGSGVNAADAPKLRAEFKKLGIKCDVSNDGNPIYTDSAHRRKCLKARGFVDRSSYC